MKPGKALDWLNFCLADVRAGVGPYLSVYLMAFHHWRADEIGIVTSAMGISTLVFQTPAGAFVDQTSRKILLIIAGSLAIGVATALVLFNVSFLTILASQIIVGLAAAFLPPAISGISLALSGYRGFENRVARNEMYTHAGTVLAALLSAAVAYWYSDEAIFVLVGVMALTSCFFATKIPEHQLDQKLARGFNVNQDAPPEGMAKLLLKDKRIIFFIIICTLFHFSNAAMLPIVGQELAIEDPENASVYMSVCIVIAQLTMVPVAYMSGRRSDKGRKGLFMIGCVVLLLRAVLYLVTSRPVALISIQVLDGIAAGIFGVVSMLIVADLARGTGRFNLMQGVLATSINLGTALSWTLTGIIVQSSGYQSAFLVLAFIALIVVALFMIFPETLKTGSTVEV